MATAREWKAEIQRAFDDAVARGPVTEEEWDRLMKTHRGRIIGTRTYIPNPSRSRATVSEKVE